MTTAQRTATYEICFDPTEGSMLIYRSIPAGICGPFSESAPCASRGEASALASVMGFMASGEWQSHANYDSCPAVLIG